MKKELENIIKETYNNYLNEEYSNGIWYHGSNVKIKNFTQTEPVNRRGNVEGFYFTNNIDNARSYGDEITYVKLNVNNPFILGKSNVNDEMIKQYAIELHKEDPHLPIDGDWIMDKCEYFKDKKRMPYTGLDGYAQQTVFRTGGYDSFLDGHEIAVFDKKNINVLDM